MVKITQGYIMPHAPILISRIGGDRTGEAGATVDSLKKAAVEIADYMPDTIIVSSPHAPCFSDFAVISDGKVLSGDFSRFGNYGISLSFKNDLKLAGKINEVAEKKGIRAGFLSPAGKNEYMMDEKLDHGALVPLFFIDEAMKKKGREFNIVHISTPFMELESIYGLGRAIGEAAEKSEGKVLYIASGDLSHCLSRGAPAGYNPEGEKYDSMIVDIVKRVDIDSLLNIDGSFMEKAAECGTRSFTMMFGVLPSRGLTTEVYSYEAPFGVGYMVAKAKGEFE